MAYTEKQHQLKLNAHEDVCIALRKIYDAKNRDYGDSFAKSFEEWGLPMSCIRINDKLNRLSSLAKGQEMLVQNEGVKDTLLDLANYAIMTLVELNMAEQNMEK